MYYNAVKCALFMRVRTGNILMNKKSKTAKTKRTVWSFEPDEELQRLMEAYLKNHPNLSRTDVLEEALKRKFPEVFLEEAERGLLEQQKLVDDLRKISAEPR